MAYQNNIPSKIIIGQVKSVSDGFYTVETVHGDYKNVPSVSGQANEGDKVDVIFGDPKAKRLPVIIGNSSVKMGESLTYPGVSPIDPVHTVPGLWPQHLGGWWLPRGQSLNPINALDGPFQQATIGGPVVFEDVTPGIQFKIHFPVLAKVNFGADAWTIYADAVQYNDETGTPYPRSAVGTEGPRLDLGIPVSHSIMFFTGQPYTGTEVWTADYTPSDSAQSPVLISLNNYTGDAADSANNFSGLVLFQSGSDQIVATLETTYANTGPVPVISQYQETISFVLPGNENPPNDQPEGLYFQPTHDPNDMVNGFVDTGFTNSSSVSGFSQGGVFYEYSPGTVGYALTIDFGESMTLYYLYGNGITTNGQTESTTADGTTDTFTMPTNGGPQSYYAGSLGNINGPSIIIRNVNSIKVNSVPETNWSFQNDQITLTYTPNNGDYIEFDFDFEELGYFTETRTNLDFFPDPFDIQSDQSPIEVALNLDHDGGGPASILEFLSINTNKSSYSVNYKWYDGDSVGIDYTYAGVSVDDYYNISGLRVFHTKDPGGPTLQLDVNIAPAVSANPVDIYDPELKPYRTNTGSSYASLKSLSLFYDPSVDGFTIAGPTGLIWRSRVQLGDPAPTPPTPAAHFTLAPWPDDGMTTSKKWEVGVETQQALPKRNCPWIGFSCSGDMGIQATWHNTGGLASVNYDDQKDSEGETDFTIRLWKRNSTTRAWANAVSFSVMNLIDQGVSGTGRMVLESGTTGPYGWRNNYPLTTLYNDAVLPDAGNGFQFYTYRAGIGYRPYAKDRRSVFLPCSWLKLQPSRSTQFLADIGYDDAGWTLNAVNPVTGSIISQFTVRSDKVNHDNLFLDLNEAFNKSMNDSVTGNNIIIDKYYNSNPIYWPPISGVDPAPPHFGGIIWAANNRFHSRYNTSELPVFWTGYITGKGPEITRNIGYPAPPHISGNQDNIQVDADEDNNSILYFSLNIPFYVRSQDLTFSLPWITKTEVTVPQTFAASQVSYPDPGSPPNAIQYVRTYDGTNIEFFVSSCRDVFVNGVGPSPAIYRSTITGIAELLRGIVVIRGPVLIGPDGGNPGYSIWEYPAITVTFTYDILDYNPAQGTAQVAHYFPIFYCFEFPTFLGFQCSPMPNAGLRGFSYAPEYIRDLITRERTYLFKVRWNGSAFAELWRKDITQRCKWPHAYSNETWYSIGDLTVACPYGEVCYATVARGRFIFTVRLGSAVEPPALDGLGNPTNLKYFLDAYENLDTEPATRVHHIELYPQYVGITLQPAPKYVTVDVDSSGRECVNIWLNQSAKMYSVRFGPNLNDPPTVTAHDEFDHSPHDFNHGAATLARSLTDYYWRHYDKVKKHTPS